MIRNALRTRQRARPPRWAAGRSRAGVVAAAAAHRGHRQVAIASLGAQQELQQAQATAEGGRIPKGVTRDDQRLGDRGVPVAQALLRPGPPGPSPAGSPITASVSVSSCLAAISSGRLPSSSAAPRAANAIGRMCGERPAPPCGTRRAPGPACPAYARWRLRHPGPIAPVPTSRPRRPRRATARRRPSGCGRPPRDRARRGRKRGSSGPGGGRRPGLRLTARDDQPAGGVVDAVAVLAPGDACRACSKSPRSSVSRSR